MTRAETMLYMCKLGYLVSEFMTAGREQALHKRRAHSDARLRRYLRLLLVVSQTG